MSRPAWVIPSSFGCAIAGVGVSVYLTIAHYTSPTVLACASSGVVNCERVTTSAQSTVLGVPVALLGLAWFLAMTALCSPWAWRSSAPWIRAARQVAVWTAMAFVLWLVYAELFVIRAICLWCTAAHVLAFALFVIVVLYGSDTEADRA
jgi:uncharacterized membrane protein